MIHQTPKALPLPCFIFKPKQPYSFCISFPGFHCRLCSAHLLLLCWGKKQSKKVVMSLMVSSCCSFMLHADLPAAPSCFMLIFLCSSVLFGVPPPMRVTYAPSGLSLFWCGWPWHEWPHSLRGIFATVPPGGLLLAWNLYCPEHIYGHVFPLQSPSVSLSNHVLVHLLSLLAGSLCVLRQEYSVLPRPVEGLVCTSSVGATMTRL